MSPLLLTALLACKSTPDTDGPPPPEPGALMVGVAQVRMPAPVGIGTVGFGPDLGVQSDTPFADFYPGTTAVHNHPDFRAVAVSRGEGFEVVFLRSDTIGMFQQLRRAVVLELQQRTGRDFDDVLVIGATHTHSGPGRLVQGGGMFDVIADRFHPEFYERMVHAMADVVEAALADLKPGRVGLGYAYSSEGHNDRRCEDGLIYENPEIPLVAVEQEGTLVGLHMAYAIHGTVFDRGDLLLSQDVSGAIEQAVQARFDHPVHVQMFNSWGADMAPSDPDLPSREGGDWNPQYDRIERVGIVVADAVEAAIDSLEWTDTPDIAMQTWRVAIDREVIGYAPGEFDYPYGGVYCSVSDDLVTCDGGQHLDGLDEACLPFTATYPAPNQTEISAGRVGDLAFVTFPGEPGTLLAEHIMEGIRDAHPEIEDIAFFGYSQDYLGYSILEEDWWNGGYEASGALWGPRQGEYLAARTIDAFDWTFGDSSPASQPDIIAPFDVGTYTPYAPTPGTQVGTVLVDVPADATWSDTLEFEIAGSDPWLGPPVAVLIDGAGDPVTLPGGQPVDSNGQGFHVSLVPEPSYDDSPDAPTRLFRWIFQVPVRHRYAAGLPDLEGAYRFEVSIPLGDGTLQTATTSPFTVSAL
ncbi:MAG: neutral/alkaline non-lysosomal ceramidase N-terminal domain-containing protein [Alphaproteobacteria bacterium]|nr:neutral/alkaline non-lysosomal ceramidase N-terminal domain-containing protein [Alphaproteobacteria bacterium]